MRPAALPPFFQSPSCVRVFPRGDDCTRSGVVSFMFLRAIGTGRPHEKWRSVSGQGPCSDDSHAIVHLAHHLTRA